jgi:hypothetical protein
MQFIHIRFYIPIWELLIHVRNTAHEGGTMGRKWRFH